jgi:hypothetical protein
VYRIDYALVSKYACCSTEAVSTLSVYDVLHHTTSIPSNNAQGPQGGRHRSSSSSRGSRGRGGSSSDAEDGAPGAVQGRSMLRVSTKAVHAILLVGSRLL